MIKLANKDNVDPIDGEYIFGKPRDRVGTIAGTLGNFKNFNDILQLPDKMAFEAGITPNNLPDNDYNGWQIYAALIELISEKRKYGRFYAKISQAGTSAPTFDAQLKNDLGSSPSWAYNGVGDYTGTFSSSVFPDSTKVVILTSPLSQGVSVGINTTGGNALRVRTYAANNTASNDIISSLDIFIRVYP